MIVGNEPLFLKEVESPKSLNNNEKEKIFSTTNVSNFPKQSTKLCTSYDDKPEEANKLYLECISNTPKKFSAFYKLHQNANNINTESKVNYTGGVINKESYDLPDNYSKLNLNSKEMDNVIVQDSLRSCKSENYLINIESKDFQNFNSKLNLSSTLNLKDNTTEIRVSSSMSKIKFGDSTPNDNSDIFNNQNNISNKNLVDSIFSERLNLYRNNFQIENTFNTLNKNKLSRGHKDKLINHQYIYNKSNDNSFNSSQEHPKYLDSLQKDSNIILYIRFLDKIYFMNYHCDLFLNV